MSTHFSASDPPVLSIGMPVYNSQRWIAPAIESLLSQSYGNFELIVSDNASTDATYALCERYARRDSRIRLYRNPENIGANRNYLAVLDRARGRYFKWASSNDLCGPGFLDSCIATLEADPSAVLACPRTNLFEDTPEAGRPYPDDLELLSESARERFVFLLDNIQLNNAFNGVLRLAALRTAGPMGNFQRADIALMAELALLGKFRLVPQRLFFRRMSADATTALKTDQQVDRHLAPCASRPLRWQNWRYYCELLRVAWRRGPLTSASVRLTLTVLQRMRWARAALLRDVRHAILGSRWHEDDAEASKRTR